MTEIIARNFIGGEFQDSSTLLDSFDPAVGKVWAKIPDSTEADVEIAVAAASKAFKSWSQTPVQQRSAILNKVADILESRLDEFAELESRDQGKPVWLSKKVDIPRAVYNFRFFANYALNALNKSNYMEAADALNYTLKMPVGVAGLISPWNLPLYLLSFKLGPALSAGNTVVAKPSEMTSITAYKLCEIFNEAGLPAGVVNVVFGLGSKVGESLVKHPGVRLISFTGGTVTANRIRAASASSCKKLSLELGGKNPCVIFEDADLEKCIPTVIRSSFLNQGEICLCTSRIYVQKKLYPIFLEKFTEATRKLKVGDPKDPDVFMGALISSDHLKKVKSFIELAKSENCAILCGDGKDSLELPAKNEKGYFMLPTIITDMKDESALIQEEIFGPVTCVLPFDTEDEVITRANNVKYGLCASVWSENASVLHRVSRKLEVGTVWANCWLVRDLHMPFGGCKESGIGREGGEESMEFYTEQKTICVKL